MKIKLLVLFVILAWSFQVHAQEYSSTKSTEIIKEGSKSFYLHTVEKGNTLYNISKTYGVPPQVIRQNNPSLNDGLKLGMKLKIPKIEQKEEEFIYHIVKRKETLYQISKIYNVPIEDILRINKISNKEITTGQYLKIPSLYINAGKNIVVTNSPSQDNKVKKDKYVSYKVQPKETLFSISKRFGISTDALMYLNDLNSTHISPNQVLLIPKKLIDKENKHLSGNNKYISHKVLAKETLYGIARKYAVSVSEIQNSNELGDGQIQIGQILQIPRTLNKTGYIKHEVTERREKLAKIASYYNLSVSELKKANPNTRSKLKRGQSIQIPLGYIETDFDQKENIEQEKIVEEETPEIVSKKNKGCNKKIEQTRKYNIAIMLPLYLNQVDSLLTLDEAELINKSKAKPFKFIEFYEGALLAAQELSEEGLDFELFVYDIPRNADSTIKMLTDPKLQKMDLIISLSYRNSFKILSDFSREYKIPLVNALSKRREIIYSNPFVFKIEPKEEALYKKTCNYILNNYRNHNIILVKSNPYQLAKEFSYMQETLQLGIPLETELLNSNILYKVNSWEMQYKDTSPANFAFAATENLKKDNPLFDYSHIQAFPADTLIINNSLKTVTYSKDSLQGIMDASSLFRNNLVVALGQDEIFAIELFTQLNSVRDSFNYEVIGIPYWTNFTSLNVQYTQPMKLHIINYKYVDYSRPEVKSFVLKFRKKYAIEPEITKHAFLGYDLSKYFLTALKDFGPNFVNCLDEVKVNLLQNDLIFEHNPETGYENTNWNVLLQESYQYHKVD